MATSKFKRECQAAARDIGVSVEFYDRTERGSHCYEDDGFLHINRGLTRAVFLIDTPQKMKAGEWNRQVRQVMTALGLTAKIGERVLRDESEDDDEGGNYCSYCGRDNSNRRCG